MHIMSFHNMYLINQEYRFNKERELLDLYGNQKDQKILFRSKEIKFYSQNGEDGILLYLFDQIGTDSKFFIEIGAGGNTSNTLNLALNFGWKGAFIDGDVNQLNMTKKFFEKSGAKLNNNKYINSFITRKNINQIINKNGIPLDIDLLSIDIDGNDFWIWKEIDIIKPRVVLIEYNASLGENESLVMKYNKNHSKYEKHPLGWYHGASLKAFYYLGNEKGYSLVCCDSLGVNAFFIRNDLINSSLKTGSISNCYYPHSRRCQIKSQEAQYDEIIKFEFVNYKE